MLPVVIGRRSLLIQLVGGSEGHIGKSGLGAVCEIIVCSVLLSVVLWPHLLSLVPTRILATIVLRSLYLLGRTLASAATVWNILPAVARSISLRRQALQVIIRSSVLNIIQVEFGDLILMIHDIRVRILLASVLWLTPSLLLFNVYRRSLAASNVLFVALLLFQGRPALLGVLLLLPLEFVELTLGDLQLFEQLLKHLSQLLQCNDHPSVLLLCLLYLLDYLLHVAALQLLALFF